MSLGPEIKHSLLRGICRNFRRLKSYLVTNPMWRDEERRAVVEAPQTHSQFQQQDFPPVMLLLLPLSFRVHGQLLKEVPACKSNTKEKKGFCKV